MMVDVFIPLVMSAKSCKVSSTVTETAVPWRDLPRAEFGPWSTVWKRHCRYVVHGTCDRVLMYLLAIADPDGQLDWTLSVDATINLAHHHSTNTTLPYHYTARCV